jgi:DNA invertase Pin-like site-specific DNA recombinase
MKAVVYTRISLDRFGDSSGVTRQHEDALQLVKQRGWQLVAEYQDNDISAAGRAHRPGFDALIDHITTGEIEAVVAWSFDRLSRNRRDELRLIEACQEHSITLALVRGSDIDMSTPAGRMVADIMATTARHEIEVKSDRQKRANLQRAQQGKPHLTQRAFGYGDDGIEVIPAEAELIRHGYSQIIAGASLKSVARDWNQTGTTTTVGEPFNGHKVRRIILNPRYMGYRYHNGQRAGKAIWEPIVSEDVFEAAKAILEDPKRSTVKDRSVKWLLPGIAECGKCEPGVKVTTHRTTHGKRNYACTRSKHLTRAAVPIDELTEAVIFERLSRPDAEQLLRPKESEVDVTALRDESNAQRARITEAAQLFADGKIQATQLETITASCEQRIRELEKVIGESVTASPLVGLLEASDIERAWRGLDIMLQREIVKTLFDRIVLEPVKRGSRIFRPESITFVWKGQGNDN